MSSPSTAPSNPPEALKKLCAELESHGLVKGTRLTELGERLLGCAAEIHLTSVWDVGRSTIVESGFMSGAEGDPWDYTKDGNVWKSCAVVASDGKKNDILLHACGPAIDWHRDQVGNDCADLGLEAPGPGVWVWEGSMGAVRCFSLDYGEDWDHEVTGEWREPTEEEWERIKSEECPWDKENLPRWPSAPRDDSR